MIIIGTFQYSIELEYALCQLESIGIAREHLLVVCMDKESQAFQSDQPIEEDSHSKGIEIGIACATALSVIGTCLGYKWTWGPIIWGIIAAFIGFGLGFGIHAILSKKKNRRQQDKHKSDVTVIVQCQDFQADAVQKVMWGNRATSVGLAPASTE
jgi:hypothetical protein